MNKEKDYVIEIMNKWYSALKNNNSKVEPKAATILGSILSEYDFTPKEKEPDVFDKYLNTPADKMNDFWKKLSDSDKAFIEAQRQKMRDQYYVSQNKQLLKG